jgi:hypothetical protein
MAKWSRVWAASLSETDPPVASLTEMIIQFVDLYASVRQGEVTDPVVIIRDALLLEKALEAWENILPPTWKYQVLQSSQSDGTYDGQYHIYSDHWIARMWDHYSWTRILVHDLILTQMILLPLLPPDISNQQGQSLSIISHLASRICASAASQLYRPSTTIQGRGLDTQMTGVFMLLWPLKVAGSAIGVPEKLHEWIIDVLEDIGLKMGIKQTRMVILTTIIQRECWKTNMALICGDNMYS